MFDLPTFLSVCDAFEVLAPDCDTPVGAAQIACENHGLDVDPSRGVPGPALAIVVSFARSCPPVSTHPEWAARFGRALGGVA